MAEELKLLGTNRSPLSHRVEVALRLKGLEYEFINEDVYGNKSALLLKSNPVHKKIPVLLHHGKPLPESLLILDYIDEVFGDYPLLPENPYDRAVARFWAKFIDDKALPALMAACWNDGEEQEKAVEEALSVLKLLESELNDKPFFGGERVGYVDIAANVLSFWFGIIQEIAGVELICSDKFPKLCQWRDEFLSVSCVKETLPQERVVAFLRVGGETSVQFFNPINELLPRIVPIYLRHKAHLP